MKTVRLEDLLAKIMLYGVLIAAVVMLAGGVVYLALHAHARPVDHIFSGEPADLRHPVAMFRDALRGSDPAIIQIGVLLLLLNPVVRVAFAGAGYAMRRDWLYAIVSTVVLAVLLYSFLL